MIAGVDFGSTLTKAVWETEGNYQFETVTSDGYAYLEKKLADSGVTTIHCTGIGYARGQHTLLGGFSYHALPHASEEEYINNEITTQANGARILLKESGITLDDFLLVAIGTGTSYTIVNSDDIQKLPLGNSMGGGYILGHAQTAGAVSYDDICAYALQGTSQDICVKDMLPTLAGTFQGELVIANGGKLSAATPAHDFYATLFTTAATAIAKDIHLYDTCTSFEVPNDIVYIGSAIEHADFLKQTLTGITYVLGKKYHSPHNAAYAQAMGALHTQTMQQI